MPDTRSVDRPQPQDQPRSGTASISASRLGDRFSPSQQGRAKREHRPPPGPPCKDHADRLWPTPIGLAADQALALAESTFQTQKAAYDLVQRQYEIGIATELDLRRAQMPVDTARADMAHYTQLVAQDENALSLLAGSGVSQSLLPDHLAGIEPLAEISYGLSSEVLLSRPDIIAAEHQLQGAYANIGAARAAFFPSISLTGLFGTASDELSGLFDSGTGTWSYAAQAAMPIFDARTWSAYEVTQVQRDVAVAEYEKAIQSAFREVADALAVRGTVDRQIDAQKSLVDAATETYRLSSARYEKGLDSYLGVLDAQRSLYAAQQGLSTALAARQVSGHAALGRWRLDGLALTHRASRQKVWLTEHIGYSICTLRQSRLERLVPMQAHKPLQRKRGTDHVGRNRTLDLGALSVRRTIGMGRPGALS